MIPISKQTTVYESRDPVDFLMKTNTTSCDIKECQNLTRHIIAIPDFGGNM
jgi:hypothetical protein